MSSGDEALFPRQYRTLRPDHPRHRAPGARRDIRSLKQWRKDQVDTPVLILTARDGWSERVDGLDAGADDYMAKPFHMPELSARIRAMLRRQAGRTDPVFEKGSDELVTRRSNRVLKDGMPVSLTAQEVSVLSYLFHNSRGAPYPAPSYPITSTNTMAIATPTRSRCSSTG